MGIVRKIIAIAAAAGVLAFASGAVNHADAAPLKPKVTVTALAFGGQGDWPFGK